MFELLKNNEIQTILSLIEQGADINIIDSKTKSFLINVIHSVRRSETSPNLFERNLEVLHKLIEYKVDLEYTDRFKNTAFIYACGLQKIDIVRILIDSNANLGHANQIDQDGLFFAMEAGNVELVELIINSDNYEQIRKKDKDGNTSLHHACYYGNIDVVRLFIDKSIANNTLSQDINEINNDGCTILMYAVLGGDLDICKLILEIDKNNINIFDNTYCSALTLACRNDHIDIVKLLLDNGSVNIINEINNVEYQENDDEWATDDEEDLADIEADEDEEDAGEEAPVEGNNILEIEYNILDEEINYDDLDEDEEFNEICTPLMIACKRGYVELAKLLLSRGADIKIQNVYYRTALDLALRSGHLEIVSIIQKWEFTMAMLVLQKLELYYWLDFANYIDLDNLLRSN